jgi:DNA-binding response OmpR family regulator
MSAQMQLPLVQRTFRRELNEWLDVLGRWRLALQQEEPESQARPVRRLAESLADAAETFALAELEGAARTVLQTPSPRPLADRLDELLDVIRREMHPLQHPRRLVLVVSADGPLVEEAVRFAQPHAARIETCAATGAARSFVTRDHVGLVILDLDTEEDPLGWLVELRRSPAGPELPVLCVSSSGETRPDALLLGASEFWKKPVPVVLLQAALASHLGQEGRTLLELAGDPATGLPGPALFREAVADLAIRHQGRAWCAALVSWRNREALADNPTLTQVALRAIADGLRESFPEPTLVTRLDQDSFGLLIPQADPDQVSIMLERAMSRLVQTAPSLLDLGVGAVVCLEADYGTVLATARRMQNLASIAGQRVLLTTLDEVPQQKLLLVDEDPELANLLRTLLRTLRVEVIFRRSAVEALETAGSAAFDLVMLSASLPNHAAFDLLATLRGWRHYEQRPLIVLVSQDEAIDETRVRAYELGADDCLSLPFNPEVLRARLRALLAR